MPRHLCHLTCTAFIAYRLKGYLSLRWSTLFQAKKRLAVNEIELQVPDLTGGLSISTGLYEGI